MQRHGRRPDAEEYLRRIAQEGGDLFRGASAWAEDTPGWRRTAGELLREPEGPMRRTIWDDPKGADTRLVVDIVECGSAALAVRAVLDRLEWNQLLEVPRGPDHLGLASFAHPKDVPPAVFFARANLCVTVASFGPRPAAVLPVAEAVDRRLLREPDRQGPGLGVEVVRDPTGAREPLVRVFLRYTLGQEGHLRFRATGGTLEIRDDEVTFVRAAGGDTAVEVFAEEPGRPTASGRAVVPR